MEHTTKQFSDLHQDWMATHLKTFERLQKGYEISQNWEARVGQTPKELVYEVGRTRLYHHPAQSTDIKYKTPLVIAFSLINRSYILDLKPGKSIVEKMVQAGFDVYLIDWGVPGPADQYVTLDDYINRYLYQMIRFVRQHAESEQVSLMGYCMGGTMAGMYTALHPQDIRNLILMAAPFDFSCQEGLLNLWADKQFFNVDKLVEAMGNIPPWFLQSSFTLLKPMQNMVDKYVKFYERLEDEAFVDDFLTMEYWLNDNIPLAGQVYKQFVHDCFHGNLLIQNKMLLGKHRVDLQQIACPLLSIVASQDHLVPACDSVPLHNVVSSQDEEIINFPSGHIGLSVSSRAMNDLWPRVSDWLGKRSEPFPSTNPQNKGRQKRPKKSS